MTKVKKGKLYRLVGHKGLSREWVARNGTVWLALGGEKKCDEHIVARFKAVASGCVFTLTRYKPWSVDLEELDGLDA